MKAMIKVNHEAVNVHWNEARECWHDRKKNLYLDGNKLEFFEKDDINWEQRKWELCEKVFLKDRYKYQSPQTAAKEIVESVDLLIKEYKAKEL